MEFAKLLASRFNNFLMALNTIDRFKIYIQIQKYNNT